MSEQPDAAFSLILKRVHGVSLVDVDRLKSIYETALSIVNTIPGDFAEFGVYKGGTAFLLSYVLAHAATKKKLYDRALFLYDTFTGIPETDVLPGGHHEGDFNDTSLAQVQMFLSDLPTRVVYVPGMFPRSAYDQNKGVGEMFAFAHLDADTYQSTRYGLSFFWPRIVTGGSIILDDYQWTNCPGVEKAVSEHIESSSSVVSVSQNARYQITLTKGASCARKTS